MKELLQDLLKVLEYHGAEIFVKQQENDSFLFLQVKSGDEYRDLDSGYRDLSISPANLKRQIPLEQDAPPEVWAELTQEELDTWGVTIDEIIADPSLLSDYDDLLPKMHGGRDYSPDVEEGAEVLIEIVGRTFSMKIVTGECIEATWCHTINRTAVEDFKEIKI